MTNIINTLTNPSSIAVIGASRNPNKVGHQVVKNIIDGGYKGKLYPVNPNASKILGLKVFPSLYDIPEKVDIAVIITPAVLVDIILKEAQQSKVKAAIIISAGFAEISGKGTQLQRQVEDTIKLGDTRVLGPNCLGVFSTIHHLNATFGPTLPDPGNVMLISQSGAMVTAVLDWCTVHNIGLSHAVTLGNRIDISENEALDFALHDRHTKVIMAYIESFKDARTFFSIASQLPHNKHLILLKGGATKSGAKASASHTAALTSDFDLLKAFSAQTGVTVTESIEDWLNTAAMASVSPSMKGDDIAIITNAGGPGVVTSDAADRQDLKVATLDHQTLDELKKSLDLRDVHNPIDILGDAAPEEFYKALSIAHKDPVADALLVLVTPQTTTYPIQTAEYIAKFATSSKKPVVVCLIGGAQFKKAEDILHHHRIPVVTFPHDAIRLLKIRANQRQKKSLEFPPNIASPVPEKKRATLEKLLSGPVTLENAIKILKSYNIAIPQSHIVDAVKDVPAAYAKLSPPIIIKTANLSILHKAKAGGVFPNITSVLQARHAYQKLAPLGNQVLLQEMVPIELEIIIGGGNDPVVGPYLTLGLGGAYTNALEDRQFIILPARGIEFRSAFTHTKASKLIKEAKLNQKSLLDLAQKLGHIICDYPQISEIEINPVILNQDGAYAADIKIQTV